MSGFIRRRQSLLTALIITAGLGAWMASGYLRDAPANPGTAVEPHPRAATPFGVRVITLVSSEISRDVVIHGHTEPARTVRLKSETDGRVVALGAEKGAAVEKGATTMQIDLRDREARLEEARAAVKRWELQYEAARALSTRNYQSETQVAESYAALQAAHAAVRRVEVEIINTRILAPFDGVLDARPVEIGDYVAAGDHVATIIEVDPILVVGDVNQQERHLLSKGLVGRAELITGEVVTGTVRFVGVTSDEATRTFRVELEVANPGRTIAAGVTAELILPTTVSRAHKLSPALLSLDAQERIGVKSVGDDDRVEFHPIEILRADPDGIWVTGLRDGIRVIAIGQGFVAPGDRVSPTPLESAPS